MRKFAFISKGNIAAVVGLFLIVSAAGLEFSYRNSPVIIKQVETYVNSITIEHTSQLSSTGSLAINTRTEATRSTRYTSVTTFVSHSTVTAQTIIRRCTLQTFRSIQVM